MSEEEFYESEPHENEEEDEGEFGDTFLSEDQANDDVNVLVIPKLNFDLDHSIETTIKILKKCKTNDEAYNVLVSLCEQISLVTVIQNSYEEIQEKVSALEELIGRIQ